MPGISRQERMVSQLPLPTILCTKVCKKDLHTFPSRGFGELRKISIQTPVPKHLSALPVSLEHPAVLFCMGKGVVEEKEGKGWPLQCYGDRQVGEEVQGPLPVLSRSCHSNLLDPSSLTSWGHGAKKSHK